MPRPRKWRKVCEMPRCTKFGPKHGQAFGKIVMTVDEYETIRLIDLEGLTQEECCEQMEVARTTVQAIYSSARKKLADSVVNGLQLCIEGGEYRLCEHNDGECGQNCCHKKCECDCPIISAANNSQDNNN